MGVISNVNGTFTKQCGQSHSKTRSDESGTRCADAMGLTLSGSTQKSSSVRWCLAKHQLWRSPSVFIQPWKITTSDEDIKVEGGSHDYERKNTHSLGLFLFVVILQSLRVLFQPMRRQSKDSKYIRRKQGRDLWPAYKTI